MTTAVAKLLRLSRSKTTGNVIITFSLVISIALFINGYIKGISSTLESLIILGGVLVGFFFSIFVNRHMRKPFFNEINRYIEELKSRRFSIQQASVQAELIEPLQPLTSINTILSELNSIRHEIENLAKLTSEEASLDNAPIQNEEIQTEFRKILQTAAQALEELDQKRKNILFLAKTRQIMFTTIKRHITRPRHEIESDYLFFKLQKSMKGYPLDEQVFTRILSHALATGELEGGFEPRGNGEYILTVTKAPPGVRIDEDVSWPESTRTDPRREQCVICRHPIHSSEAKVQCQVCQNSFHKNHLLEWLKVFGDCPICHNRMAILSD